MGDFRLYKESGDETAFEILNYDNAYTLNTPLEIYEPGHSGCGDHDWHEGSEYFDFVAKKVAPLTLKASVTPKGLDQGGESKREATIVLLPMEMKVTDRDDPTKKWTDAKDWTATKPIYSGEKNGDMVSWKLGGTDSWTNATFSWSAEGPETKTGPSGTGKKEWKIADGDEDPQHDWIDWKPGKYKIKCTISSGSESSSTIELDQEIGARTTDVVVIGWINPAGVPLSAAGMPSDMISYYPPGGSISSMTQKLLTAAHLGVVSAGATIRPGPPVAMTAAEKIYMLRWLFKYGANNPPPNSFSDEATFKQFRDEPINYKLYNRFQIKYLLNDARTEFKENPKILKDEAPATRIGTTLDPIFHQRHPGQRQEAGGQQQIKDNKVYHQTNDGSPESLAVNAFNTLIAPDKWNDIGSTISLGVEFGLRYNVLQQVYPTYYIYERIQDGGFYLYQVIPQAPTPEGNFNANPYYPPPYHGPAPFIIKP